MAAEMELACPVCDATSYRYLFTKNGRRFWECKSCRVQRIMPLPPPEELERHYRTSYEQGLYRKQLDAPAINGRRAELRLKEILPMCRTGRWLDVGCSEGDFVATARRNELEAVGIDLSEPAVARARARGLPVTCSTVSDHRPAVPYDTITAFDVIEHVLDPFAFLQSIWQLLLPGGNVVLTTPNLSSLSRLVMGRRWYFYIPEEHLFYFRRASLCRLLERAGFEVVNVYATSKHVSCDYALQQLEEYNPLIHKMLSRLVPALPPSVRNAPFPLRLGELLAIACKSRADAASHPRGGDQA